MVETETPLCSVCIANFNGETYIADCINSVLKQDFDFPVEIVIHDDASTDNSVDIIRTNYPTIALIASDENVGFCISNNRMVQAARGRYVLLLNNDATLRVDALRNLYEASLDYGKGIWGLPQYNAKTGELIDVGSYFDLFLNPIPNKKKGEFDVGMVIGACIWIDKLLWHEINGFPEWFGSVAEDTYVCLSARLRGYPVKVIPFSGFDHLVGQNLGGGKVHENRRLHTSSHRRALSERNKTSVMVICYPLPILIVIFPLHLILLSVEGCLISVIKRDRKMWTDIYWLSFKEIWSKRKLLVKTRKKTQKFKVISVTEFLKVFRVFPHKLRMLMKHGMPGID